MWKRLIATGWPFAPGAARRAAWLGVLLAGLLVGPAAFAGADEPAWQTDPETGRRYRVERFPATPGRFVILPDGRVRLHDGIVGTLERKSDEAIWVRVYEVPRFVPRGDAKASGEESRPRAPVKLPPLVDRLRQRPFEEGLPRSGQWRGAFDIADLNGDGHPDIALAPPRRARAPRPLIFLGDGAGRFTHWASARFPALAYDYGAAAAGDLDGDGRLDLVLGAHLGKIEVLRGGEGGRFSHAGGLGTGEETFSSTAVAIADFDGDGRPDVVALGEGPRPPDLAGARGVRVFLSQDDGTFVPAGGTGDGLARNFGRDLAIADVDGDGRADVLASTGILGFTRILGVQSPEGVLRGRALPLPGAASVEAVAASDLDGDGDTDLAVAFRRRTAAGWRTGVELLVRDGAGGFQPTRLFSESGAFGVHGIDAGDLDADGFTDLAACTGDGRILVWAGSAAGMAREEAPELAAAGSGCPCSALRIAQLGGGPGAELIAAFGSESCPGGGRLRAFSADP